MEPLVFIDVTTPGGPEAEFHFMPDCDRIDGGSALQQRLAAIPAQERPRELASLLAQPELRFVMQVTRNEVPLRRACRRCHPRG